MKFHSIRGTLLAVVLALALTVPALAYDDTAGHWGAEAIDRWSEEDVLQGYAGQFRPDAPITRGELAVILDRLMDYQTLSDTAYPDVEADSWYEEAVLGAAQANILQGDGTSLRPLDPITRQEAAVLLGRALGVTEDAAGLEGFADAGEAAGWAAGYLGGMAQAGILSGYQGRIMPAATITRAEVAQLLDNAVAARWDEGGSYTADADGNVIVSAAGVTLSDMTIDGNLIAAEGIGDGDLILDNVTVKGALVVRGGGEHSIIIKGNSSVSTITAQRRDGGVRLSVEDDASVEIITIDDGSDAVIVAGTVGTLNVAGTEAQVTVAGTVDTLTVSEQAEGASITVSGGATVNNLTAAAPNTAVTVGKGGTVESVTANGTGTTVSGAGKVENVTANADNVAVSTPNTKVEASEGTSGVTAGDKDVAGGSSATTPGGSSSGGSSSGGGSSVSYYTVTYQFLDQVLGTERVASGGHPTASGITVPSKVGYMFVGWKVEGEWPPVELSDITVTGNVTLYAQLAAVPDGTVTAITEGITIGETDPDTFLNPVTGNLAPNEEGDYVLTLQLKAPEGVECEPMVDVLLLTTSADGYEGAQVWYPYDAFDENGILTLDYVVAPAGATSCNQVLTFFLKWHGVNSDADMGGWAMDLDLSSLTLVGVDPSDTVATVGGVGYPTLKAAVDAILKDPGSAGEFYLVSDYTLTEDVTLPDYWTLGIHEGVTLTIPETVTLDNLYAILNHGTISGEGTLRSGNTIWNRGVIDCTVVNYQPEGSDWAVEYYQYAQWNGEGWTLAPLPNMANETDCSIFAAFNFEEDLNGSDTALAKAIDRINDIPESAGYTFHLLEARCQLTVNSELTLPANTSLALMGGEGRGITIEEGGSILNGNVEIITFEGYPVAQLTVKNGAALTGELYITGNIEECLVVEDGATVECTLFQRNTQEEEYRPIGEAEYDGRFWLTLEDALNAAQADGGGEVFLVQNVTVGGNLTIPANVVLWTDQYDLSVAETLTVDGEVFVQGGTTLSADSLALSLEEQSQVHVEYDAALDVAGLLTLNGNLFVDGTGRVTADKIDMSAGAFYYHGISANDDGSWAIPDHPPIEAEDPSRVNCALNFPDLGNDNEAVDAMIRATIQAVQNNNAYGNYCLELRNNYTLAAGETLILPDNVTLLVRDSSDNWELEEQTPYLITIEGTLTGGKLDFASSGFEGFEGHTSLIVKDGGTVSCNQYWLEGDDKLVVESGGKLMVPDFVEAENDGGWMYLVDGMNLVIDQGGTMTCSGILRIWPGSTLTINGTMELAGDAHAGYQGDINGTGSITGTGTLQDRGGNLTVTTIGSDIIQDAYNSEP
ncbi:S-layer homology domain-containing protein [Flavonifractor sp. An112]|uniref:S-layer homology domain-containing protein n=1 Tax=Flavonifractor sp. An112 TaxID=1965544 RepID=UPI001302B14B|nr:S-layer homology domain-containing protein [Flavonifractor sp. An112]